MLYLLQKQFVSKDGTVLWSDWATYNNEQWDMLYKRTENDWIELPENNVNALLSIEGEHQHSVIYYYEPKVHIQWRVIKIKRSIKINEASLKVG